METRAHIAPRGPSPLLTRAASLEALSELEDDRGNPGAAQRYRAEAERLRALAWTRAAVTPAA